MAGAAKQNKLHTRILDVGCGKGYLGNFLKADGFMQVQGMDRDKAVLQMA